MNAYFLQNMTGRSYQIIKNKYNAVPVKIEEWVKVSYFIVWCFIGGKTLGYLWSLRLLNQCTGWTKWPQFWPSRPEFLEFFLYKTYIRLAKTKFCVFWQTLKPNITKLRPYLKKWSQVVANCLKILNLLSSPLWRKKIYLNFSILQLWRANQSRCDQVWWRFKMDIF